VRRGQGLGHGVILARPSRGTLAATFVLGVTIGLAALARAERNRRAPRPRPANRDRHFGLLPHETPARGLKRVTLSQLDLAIELLRGEGAVPAAERVHETRKALKRVRAMLRLLEDELGRKRSARAQAVLRDAAAGLAETRDAEVMVGTLEQLLRRHPRRLRRRRALIELREALERERQTPGTTAASNGSAATAGPAGNAYAGEHAEIAADLAALRARVERWDLRDRSLERLVQPGLRRVYRKGRGRWVRAAARKPSPTALHRWRKEVKDLRYVLEVLDVHGGPSGRASAVASAGPSASAGAGAYAGASASAGAGLSRRTRAPVSQTRSARKRARRLAKLTRRSDALGELLGEEHDLALLAERVRAHGPLKRRKRARRALLRTIARRRARLREQALRNGARLYARKPKRFARWVRASYRGWARA
jgi:CHAD domain-containing protein